MSDSPPDSAMHLTEAGMQQLYKDYCHHYLVALHQHGRWQATREAIVKMRYVMQGPESNPRILERSKNMLSVLIEGEKDLADSILEHFAEVKRIITIMEQATVRPTYSHVETYMQMMCVARDILDFDPFDVSATQDRTG